MDVKHVHMSRALNKVPARIHTCDFLTLGRALYSPDSQSARPYTRFLSDMHPV